MDIARTLLFSFATFLLLLLVIQTSHEPKRLEQITNAVNAQATSLSQLETALGQINERLEELSERQDVMAELESLQAQLNDQQNLDRAIADLSSAIERLRVSGVAVASPVENAAPDDTTVTETTEPEGQSDITQGILQDEGADDPKRTGTPALGHNFLLPYDGSHFQPSLVGGELRAFGTTPPGLNPIIENAANVTTIHNTISDALCERDDVNPSLWRASLATSCVISDDYLTYTFEIRPGVMWQVPSIATANPDQFGWLNQQVELTAEDFVFAIEIGMHEDVQAPVHKAYYTDLESIRALDTYTLELRWKRKIFTSLTSSMAIQPLPRHVYTRNQDGDLLPPEQVPLAFNRHWFDENKQAIGVGRYVFQSYEPDEEIRYRANPRYWGAPGHFESMYANCAIKDDDPRLTAFKNGQVSTYSLSPTQYKTNIIDQRESRFDFENGRNGELGWERTKALVYYYLGWNMRRPLFQDRQVRQALAHAFPKQRIIDQVFFGLGQPADGPVHPDTAYYNNQLPAYDFDLDRAQELLFEAGWSDTNGNGLLDKMIDGERKEFSFTVKGYANSPEWERTLSIFQNELQRIGIEMNFLALEWKDLVKVYEDRDFDAVIGGWRLGYEVDFEQLWHSKFANEPRSSNHCGFENARADELAERLRETFDQDERVAIAREFQEIIATEQPYLFFRTGESIFVWQNQGENALGGVIDALDTLHPFYSRDSKYWYEAR